MTKNSQWLDLGLQSQPQETANRVRLFRLLLAKAALLRTRLDKQLAPSGVTTQQGAMLQWIEAQPEAPTISAVAAGLHMTHQNVKQIALALERKAFLRIEVDTTDRRARRLVLTDHHHAFWAQRNPNDFSQLVGWTDTWSDAEVQTLVDLLRRLKEDLSVSD
jgi:DNA-binding MarR family transcriptional regulator